MRYITYVICLIIVILLAIFVTINSHMVNINYYFGSIEIYLPLLLFILLVVGAILGILATLPWLFRSKAQTRKLRREMGKRVES